MRNATIYGEKTVIAKNSWLFLPYIWLLALLYNLLGCQPIDNGNNASTPQTELMNTMEHFIEASKNGKSITEYSIPQEIPKNIDATKASNYIESHPDSSAFHLLLLLNEHHRSIYKELPKDVKAKVFCDALANTHFLNDWGSLGPTQSFDTNIAKLLIDLNSVALPFLYKMLDDKRPALLYGSEEATLSKLYKYRRADFAYRYIMLILAREPTFSISTTERDELIELLKHEPHAN